VTRWFWLIVSLATLLEVPARSWFHITPAVQFLRNNDDKLETVVGLRAFFGFNKSWAGAGLLTQ
jgi:hypothetical protein